MMNWFDVVKLFVKGRLSLLPFPHQCDSHNKSYVAVSFPPRTCWFVFSFSGCYDSYAWIILHFVHSCMPHTKILTINAMNIDLGCNIFRFALLFGYNKTWSLMLVLLQKLTLGLAFRENISDTNWPALLNKPTWGLRPDRTVMIWFEFIKSLLRGDPHFFPFHISVILTAKYYSEFSQFGLHFHFHVVDILMHK